MMSQIPVPFRGKLCDEARENHNEINSTTFSFWIITVWNAHFDLGDNPNQDTKIMVAVGAHRLEMEGLISRDRRSFSGSLAVSLICHGQ